MLEAFDISDDHLGVVNNADDDDDDEETGRLVKPATGYGSNEEDGGEAGWEAASLLLLT